MNKTELIAKVAQEQELPKVKVEPIVESILSSITDTLAKGEKVSIFQFGNFEVRDRKARKGRNPQSGEEIDIPASKTVHFSAAKALKEKVK